MIKALREAKVNTSWTSPNARYEDLVRGFVSDALADGGRNPFVDDLDEFVHALALPGFLNSLGQTLLKLTSPGVPDIYQGNEIWDFSLVDPDNRRPVDYARRTELLAALEADAADGVRARSLPREMVSSIADGRAKLYVTWCTLRLRAELPALFERGAYVPIEVRGTRAEHVCSFARQLESERVVIAVGRWFALLPLNTRLGPAAFEWRDTTVAIPPGVYTNLLTQQTVTSGEGAGVRADELFEEFPVALLRASAKS